MLNEDVLIAFNYILKTGGTSINHALEQTYTNYRRLDWYVKQNKLNTLQIAELILTSDLVGFHTTDYFFRQQALPLILQGLKNKKIILFTLVREPIERIESIWIQQWHSDFLLGSFCPEDKQPKDYYASIDDYLEKVLEAGHEIVPQHLQLTCYQSEENSFTFLENFLQEHYLCVGTLAHFNDFFRTLQLLGLISYDLSPEKKNISPVKTQIQSEQIKNALKKMLELDYKLYALIEENNGVWLNPQLDC